jgi:hypothetical protein
VSEPLSILPEQVQAIVDQSINATLTALGIKARTISPWISQNKAFNLAGRKRVESAMDQGRIAFKKNGDKKQSRVLVSRRDIERLIRNPTL